MRKPIPAVPYARSAIWTRRLAAIGAVASIASVLLPRHSVADADHAVMLLAAGLCIAALSLPCAVAAAIVIWRTGWKGAGRTVSGLALAAFTLAYPAYVVFTTARYSQVTDVSTDPEDPPAFSTSANAVGELGPAAAAWSLAALVSRGGQSAAIEPVFLDSNSIQTHAAVIKAAKTLRWRVIEADRPRQATSASHVEAVTYSTVMRLPEDIAIRISSREGQTKIDLRSKSRLSGFATVGDDNVHNLRDFAATVEDQAAEN